jgi:hypothetical protein
VYEACEKHLRARRRLRRNVSAGLEAGARIGVKANGRAGRQVAIEISLERRALGLERGAQLGRQQREDRVEVLHGHAAGLVAERATIFICIVQVHDPLPGPGFQHHDPAWWYCSRFGHSPALPQLCRMPSSPATACHRLSNVTIAISGRAPSVPKAE